MQGQQQQQQWLLIWMLMLLATLSLASGQVMCTVGPNGTYGSIQTALFGCNGGAGAVVLEIESGNYTEPGLFFPGTLTDIYLTAVDAINVPVVPVFSELSVFIKTNNWLNTNPTLNFYFQGINIDGMGQDQPLFATPLINNNLTITNCLISNFTGNYSIRVESCAQGAVVKVQGTRWYRIWGTTISYKGLDTSIWDTVVFDRVGGYNNNSGVVLKPSYVSTGQFIFTNASHWLVKDLQPKQCLFNPDKNGMIECNNGTMLCYNLYETERLRPNCAKITIDFKDEIWNTTNTTIDYPKSCRIYTPCVCQDVMFVSNSSLDQVTLPIGDIFFYTNLRINCSLIVADNSTVPPTIGSSLLTDPVFNSTSNTTSSSSYTWLKSLAGHDGIGQLPPTGDTGWSLGVVADSGFINQTAYLNCSCANYTAPSINVTNATTGNATCDYNLGNGLRCQQGQVNNCTVAYLRCFPTYPNATLLPIPTPAPGNTTYCFLDVNATNSTTGTLVEYYNSTTLALLNLTLPPEYANASECNYSTSNITLVLPDNAGPSFTLGNYTCLGSFPANSNFTVQSQLDGPIYDTICNFTSCPVATSNLTRAGALISCGNCTQELDDAVNSTILITQVCSPYSCRRIANTSCTYTFAHSYNESLSVGNNTWNGFFWGHASPYGTDQLPYFEYNITLIVDYDPLNPPDILCPQNYLVHKFTVDRTDPSAPDVTWLIDPDHPPPIVQALIDAQNAIDPRTIASIDYQFKINCLDNYFASNHISGGVSLCDWAEYDNFTLVSQTNTTLVPYYYTEAPTVCSLGLIGCAADFVSNCSCDSDVLDVCDVDYPVSNYSAAYEFDNLHDGLSFVDISNIRAQGLPVALKLNRTPEAVIQQFTTTVVGDGFSSENAVLRRIYNWGNSLLWGTWHDIYYGAILGPTNVVKSYGYFCDGGCPQQFTKESDFDCLVDASTTVEKVNKTYKDIQKAIDGGCTNICVRSYENFYTTNLIIRNNVRRISSLDGACIVGKGHQIQVGNLTLQGLCFRHPGDLAASLFTLQNGMDSFEMLNLRLDGGGVRGGGVFQTDSGQPHITNLVLNHTEVVLWNIDTLFLTNVDYIIIAHNKFNLTTGRTIEVTYNKAFRCHDNVYLDMRGTQSIDNVAMVRFTASDETKSCNAANTLGIVNRKCTFFNNIQFADVTAVDFQDIGYSLVGGLIGPNEIYNNVIIKASKGFELRRTSGIPETSIRRVVRLNPMIRPSRFRTSSIANRQDVWDWTYDVYWNSPFFSTPVVRTSSQCVYPCGTTQFASPGFDFCEVNPNFDMGYAALGNYGYKQFHNATQALDFCQTFIPRTQLPPFGDAQEMPIMFSGDDGGVLVREVIKINRTGASFYGYVSSRDQYVAPVCFPRCNILGTGHILASDNFTMSNMSMTLVDTISRTGYNMISTPYDTSNHIYNVNITNNTFSGDNIAPFAFMQLLYLRLGFDTSSYFGSNPVQGGKTPDIFKTIRNSTAIIRHNIFKDFASFDFTRQLNGVAYNTTLDEFPFTDPIYVEFFNRLLYAMGSAFIDYNIFYGVDRRCVDMRYAWNATYIQNYCIDCGGRSPGNAAVSLFTAADNQAMPRYLYMFDNIYNQSKAILSDKTNSVTAPGWLADIVIRGYGNNSLICIGNNTLSGVPIGFRFSGLTIYQSNTSDPSILVDRGQPTLTSCMNITLNPPIMYDPQDPLRRIFHDNPNATGYVHWLVVGDSLQDFNGDWIYCDNGCIPPTPTICNVSDVDPAYSPANPFYGDYVFRDLQSAVINCKATPRIIRLKASGTGNGCYTGSLNFPLPANDTTLNSTMFSVIDIFGDPTEYVCWEGCNHSIDYGRFRFSNIEFQHVSCPGDYPTWNLDSNNPNASTRLLELVNDTFSGFDTTSLAIGGAADDAFLFDKNKFHDYLGDRIVDVTGTYCNVTVYMHKNSWDGCKGNCARLTQLGGVEFDENQLFNAGGNSSTENAVVYISLCNQTGPVPYNLYVRYNQQSTGPSLQDPGGASQYPNVSGGLNTAFWIDPVQVQYLANVDIQGMHGIGMYVCLRLDHYSNSAPNYVDPQYLPRKIALYKNNLYCKGKPTGIGFDVRINNKDPTGAHVSGDNIGWDYTVLSDLTHWAMFYCNDGCPKIDDFQLGLITGILIGMGILARCVFTIKCLPNWRLRRYRSNIVQQWITLKTFFWPSEGVTPQNSIPEVFAASQSRVQDAYKYNRL